MLSPGQDSPPNNYSSGNVVLQGAPCGQCRELCPAGYVPHFWRWVPPRVTCVICVAPLFSQTREAQVQIVDFSLPCPRHRDGGGRRRRAAIEVISQKNKIPTQADPGKILRSALRVMGGSIRCWKKRNIPSRKTGKMIASSSYHPANGRGKLARCILLCLRSHG